MAEAFKNVIEETGCDYLIPQKKPSGYLNSYYTFAVKFEGERRGISWKDFRRKYKEFSGDGIYAAWTLVYNEPAMKILNEGKIFPDGPVQFTVKGFLDKKVQYPVAEKLQKKLMQFPTNQAKDEIDFYAEALRKTIKYFE